MTSDTLGSPRVITDQYGNVTSRRDFHPFGEEIYASIGARDTTTHKYSANDNVRQGFTGYQKDKETQLDFAEARYYNSKHGRFTAVDPLLASGKSADPQTFNRYAYVMNNPLIATDPSGMLPVYYRTLADGGIEFSDGDHSNGKGGWKLYTGGEQTFTATNGNRYQVNSNGITNLGNAATQDRIDRFAAGMQQAASDTFFGGGGTAYNQFANLVNGSNWLANRLQNFRGYRENQFDYLPYYQLSTPGEQSAALATTFLMFYSGGAVSARSVPSFSGFNTATGTTAISARSASSTAYVNTGSYLHRFESGKFYAGKGPESRMTRTGNFFSRTDPIVSSEFFPATSNRAAFMNEHRLMMQNGGPLKFDPLSPTYNIIFSPGRRFF